MRILLACCALVAGIAIGGCTGSQRCDDVLPAQVMSTDAHGVTLRCDPSYDADEPADAQLVVQWNRGPYVWLWERRIDDDRVLRLLAWIGDGEVVAHNRDMFSGYDAGVPSWVAVWAAHYAFCREVIPGVGAPGYSQPPEGCGAYVD